MNLTLANDEIEFVVDTVGADQRSLRFRDEEFDCFGTWRSPESSHAIVCFPLLGNVPDGRYSWAGREYRMPQHGFAQDLDFAVMERGEAEVVLEIRDTEQTRELFPFAFRLQVAYSLSGSTLQTEYRATATGDSPLLYSVGAHPFFSCPVDDGTGLSLRDYELEFDVPVHPDAVVRTYGSRDVLASAFSADGRRLALDEALFAEGAFCLASPPSQRVRLRSSADARGVELDLGSAPYFQVWSRPGEPFVCLEPWYGAISRRPFADVDGIWGERPGTNVAQPGAWRSHRFTITPYRR